MAMETDELNQYAVVWAISGIDDYGRPTVGTAAELNVRWEHTVAENLSVQTQNQEVVAFVVVDQDVAVGSILWEGAMMDLPETPTPLYQVVSLKKTPDVKGVETRRVCLLIRYTDLLPS